MTPEFREPTSSTSAAGRYLPIILIVLTALSMARAGEDHAGYPTRVQVVSNFFNPNQPESFRNVISLMRDRPDISVEMWSGLSLPGGSARTPIIMSIAGETSPDIMQSWFHILRSDVHQGFLYPLNHWIGDDTDGDGQISVGESKWPGWADIPELWRRVATVDGKVYGLPAPNRNFLGVLFRTDLVRAAGLDPNRPPQTWEEFFDWCLRLSDPGHPVPGRSFNTGQKGVALLPFGFTWLPWLQSAGGSPLKKLITDPSTGATREVPYEDNTQTGNAKVEIRADFDSPAGLAAAGFIHQLRWTPWVIDPETANPLRLTEGEAISGRAERHGREVTFDPASVQRGVGRSVVGARETSPLRLLGRGEVAMITWFVGDILNAGTSAGVNPDLLSWFPFPAMNEESPRVVQEQRHFAAMCTNVRLRSEQDRDRIWDVLVNVTDRSARNQEIERMVVAGLARFINPTDLQKLGYADYLNEIPPEILENFRQIDTGIIHNETEPYEGFWLTMDGALNREVISLIISQTGQNFDYASALRNVTVKANSGVMFARSDAELVRYRPVAYVIFSIVLIVIIGLTALIIRQFARQKYALRSGAVSRPWLPWLLMGPAILLIGIWGYYPLLRGMVMAFQDYRIAGESLFVGLDNFITLALDSSFWASMGRTVYFVFLTMLLSFTTPILLAVMVSEVPHGKIFFRTLFFLPQVTSALVIGLIWKALYEPSPAGFFNQVIGWINYLPGIEINPQAWLLDPQLAMFCVVLPTAWATAGIQSLIYIAALKSVPEELYEACEIDNGGIFAKLRYITFPVLLPLIIINFVGAFIGTFQNMGKIFLLTFGGPGEATMVVGMRIWIEAYSNLRFSIATSMAWVLGACLIGFTYIQIQFLKRIEFRKSAD